MSKTIEQHDGQGMSSLDTLRHSAAHVLANAVKRLYPDTKLAVGPPVRNGFYYDIDREEPFTETDLVRIESEMQTIIAEDHPFERDEWSREDAIEYFSTQHEDYKLKIIDSIPDDTLSVFRNGEFLDLCRGPHVASTGCVKAVKLTSVAGAYWRGKEGNPQLQRIYGTAFNSVEELDEHLRLVEEAKLRDHRKLGPQLGYYMFHDDVGPGLPLYLPRGARLRELIQRYAVDEHLRNGYQLVGGPHILRSNIWKRSGHYEYYKDNMFIFDLDGAEYAVKPMNCPAHILIYASQTRSYRELPLRFFELGDVYRNEKSGVLHGLLRVRGFTQDDAHIFCLPEQLVDEIAEVVEFAMSMLRTFGFQEFEVELSTRPDESIGTDEDWEHATLALEQALERTNTSYVRMEGEGAFYGPKIDIRLKDALGRPWQCATVQCDFALPKRFEIAYVGQDGQEHQPIMVHRALLGSFERFMGCLLEHYAGALPVWLAPVQVKIIPISEHQLEYATSVLTQLQEAGLRAELDQRNEKMQYKIRDAETQKVPFMAVIGKREIESGAVSVRSRANGDEGSVAIAEFIARMTELDQTKSV